MREFSSIKGLTVIINLPIIIGRFIEIKIFIIKICLV